MNPTGTGRARMTEDGLYLVLTVPVASAKVKPTPDGDVFEVRISSERMKRVLRGEAVNIAL